MGKLKHVCGIIKHQSDNHGHIKISCLITAASTKETLKLSKLITARGSRVRYGEPEFSVLVQDGK
jgi:hypothetical protein